MFDPGPRAQMGLALLDDQQVGAERELTTTGQLMCTLDYMAPEQGTDSHEVDIRADVGDVGNARRQSALRRRKEH